MPLTVPKGHALAKVKKLRLRDLADASFVWFPRRESPAFYDRLMHECLRGGLKSPRIVQEGLNEATILSLVSHGMGQWTGVMAVPGKRGDRVGSRSGHAFAAGARLEKGQYVSFAHTLD
jgi:hypothetical protein